MKCSWAVSSLPEPARNRVPDRSRRVRRATRIISSHDRMPDKLLTAIRNRTTEFQMLQDTSKKDPPLEPKSDFSRTCREFSRQICTPSNNICHIYPTHG